MKGSCFYIILNDKSLFSLSLHTYCLRVHLQSVFLLSCLDISVDEKTRALATYAFFFTDFGRLNLLLASRFVCNCSNLLVQLVLRHYSLPVPSICEFSLCTICRQDGFQFNLFQNFVRVVLSCLTPIQA